MSATATDDMLSISAAARRTSLSPTTLRRRIREGELPIFVLPADRRVRLVRANDLAALRAPRPVAAREEVPQPA